MKEIAIIFTPQVREQAVTALIKQGKEVPADFRGPTFNPAPGGTVTGYIEGGVYVVFVAEDAKNLHEAVRYMYPLRSINRIKETL